MHLRKLVVIPLFTLFTSLTALADATPLPPDAIAADTVAVIRVDSTHFTPDRLQAAMNMLLGDEAKEVDEPLKKFEAFFTKATDAGVVAAAMIIEAPKKDDRKERGGTSVLYLTLKPDADVKVIEDLFTKKLMEPGDKREIAWDQADNYLAMHTKKQEFPVKTDAAREAIFVEAMKTVADASIQAVFIPDDAGRKMLRDSAANSDAKQDIRPTLAKARWTSLAIDVGNSPRVKVAASLATEDDAKATVEVIKKDMDLIRTAIAKPGPMMLAAPMIGKVLDGLKIEQANTRTSVTINAESLKLIADFVANTGMLEGRQR